jgi:hypothetical protein
MSAYQEQPSQPDLPHISQPVFYLNFFDQISDAKVRALITLCSQILATEVPTPATLYFAFSLLWRRRASWSHSIQFFTRSTR